MKSFHLWGISLLILALLLGTPGCKRETSPVPSGPDAENTSEGLTIEYETLPSILFEAESGVVTAPVALYDGPEASGGKYALAPEGPDHEEVSIGGDITYMLTVSEEGEYVLWLRTKWSGDCGNSLGITLDGQDLGEIGDAVHEQWHWVRLIRKKLKLTAGEHTMTITNREDGSAWDQVLLTRDDDYRPAGIESAKVQGRLFLTDTRTQDKPVPPSEEPSPPEP